MINILLRKFKKQKCEKCKGFFYPKVDKDGSWDASNQEQISLFDLEDEFKWTQQQDSQ